MKKIRKIVVFFLVTVFCGTFLAVGAAPVTETATEYEEQYYVVTDTAELERIVEQDELNVPEGYHLEKVETFVYTEVDDSNAGVIKQTTDIQPYGIIYEVKNKKNKGDNHIKTDQYDSDWFYGPASISETYSRTNKVEKNVSVGITNAALSSALGYSVTDEYTNVKTFSTSVASGKKLNVKVYTNYQKTTFDIYNKATQKCVQEGASTEKPVGLIFKQYTYAL